MNKTHLFTVIFSLFLLASCAASVDTAHISKMESFIGQTERNIILSWGVPDKTYELDRRTKVITYRHVSFYNDGGSGFGLSTCAGSYGRGIGYGGCLDPMPRPTRTYTYACELSFNIERGRAVSWFQNGNGCPRIK